MTLKEAETLYPEQFARWKKKVLKWLDEKEKQWNLEKPISRKAFIFDSLRQVESFPQEN
ncbi:MAG: hypothetical protein ACXU9L_04390 [Thermodesulfobacteriota bacterium]